MDLNRLSIEARTRTPWEAIDLGFILARKWWKPLFLSWFIPSACFFILVSLIFYKQPWLAMLLTWWLKPLWDRGPLYVASRYLFGEKDSIRDILKALPKVYKTDCLPWLTWQRLSLTRSFDMPVTVLEKLKSSQRQSRIGTLHYLTGNTGFWLTIVCVHLEAVIIFGLVVLAVLMVPEHIDIDYWEAFSNDDLLIQTISNILTFISMVIVAPFYTVAGFTLYISRRIDLEAWDVEVRFRHLADSYKHKARSHISSVAVLLILVSGFVFTDTVSAIGVNEKSKVTEEAGSVVVDNDKALIIEVLKGEDFNEVMKFDTWKFRDSDSDSEESEKSKIPEWLIKCIEWLEDHSEFFGSVSKNIKSSASIIEFLLWVVAISLVLYLIFYYRDTLRRLSGYDNKPVRINETPDVLFGLDVRKDSLPDNVTQQVQGLWRDGNYRPAVSLLYRATLSSLIHRLDFVFNDGHTEGECADIVDVRGDKRLSVFFKSLTHCWQQLAYGHHIPEQQLIDQLCSQWDEVFDNE